MDKEIYEAIDDFSDVVYILDYDKYLSFEVDKVATYLRYIRNEDGTEYTLESLQPYKLIGNDYIRIFDNKIYVKDSKGNYLFAADKYYHLVGASYEEITDPKYFYNDNFETDRKILKFGEYYIYKDGRWLLDPENCYILLIENGVARYILATEAGKYNDQIISEEDCFIRHSDGHFIRLTDTDYYIRTHNDHSDTYDEFVFNQEECYIISSSPTEYYDPSLSTILG